MQGEGRFTTASANTLRVSVSGAAFFLAALFLRMTAKAQTAATNTAHINMPDTAGIMSV